MEIISEKQISNKQAIHFLKKSSKDSYLEENDPELAKNLTLLLTELQAHSANIFVPDQIPNEETKQKEKSPVEEQPKNAEKIDQNIEETHSERKHRHKKHRSEKNQGEQQ